ncbi:hypothetical protein COCON_G00041140 [Conger conger]|uniref:Uncharacterized protein n=1 Tax=Conger conger TaxID=82655 RepID=A0A9Q1I4K8_CONCO|nr:hypothetical protein COCON_G00041140 [Conger conger]
MGSNWEQNVLQSSSEPEDGHTDTMYHGTSREETEQICGMAPSGLGEDSVGAPDRDPVEVPDASGLRRRRKVLQNNSEPEDGHTDTMYHKISREETEQICGMAPSGLGEDSVGAPDRDPVEVPDASGLRRRQKVLQNNSEPEDGHTDTMYHKISREETEQICGMAPSGLGRTAWGPLTVTLWRCPTRQAFAVAR